MPGEAGSARQAANDGFVRLPFKLICTYLDRVIFLKISEMSYMWGCHLQGMCYSEPVLTGEDKAWSDGPSDHYDSDVEEPQTSPNKVPVSVRRPLVRSLWLVSSDFGTMLHLDCV